MFLRTEHEKVLILFENILNKCTASYITSILFTLK